MRTKALLVASALIAFTTAPAFAQVTKPAAPPDWSFNATIIEACSCPMFCTCYFNPSPAGHHGMGHPP